VEVAIIVHFMSSEQRVDSLMMSLIQQVEMVLVHVLKSNERSDG